MLQLTPTNCTQRPRCAPGSSPPDGVSQGHFNLTPHSRLGLALIPNYNAPTAPPGSNDLFTIPAINTRPFPVFWPHSHGFGNHFPKGHPSFNYSSPSTLNWSYL
ncbi:unnamed protein product [Microthlaspi erraticum]|uniref:Uncharacterized protein n=1 Tax=Microthlaspi erraticum TaxID=1685480 RepID=A0A6D2IH45_9BRAS|nr:unnamed protein product [Microthlaspi erraticum]